MAMSRIKWTEKKIAQLTSEGRGEGRGSTYLPWLDARMLSSTGRTRRLWSPMVGRVHQLFSDVEHRLFLALEWQRDITDIREQFPLDRDLTQDVARSLGIRHPYYPGGDVPTVMTVDFMVTRVRNGAEELVAFNAKRTEEAEDENSLVKLEIQRATCELLEIPHHLVFHTDIPEQNVKNIDWIRDSLPKPGDEEPRPGFWTSMTTRLSQSLARADGQARLAEFCAEFDGMHGVEAGTGLRAARMLMFERVLTVDLASVAIQDLPLSTFTVTGAGGKLRAMGAA
jgi:hypothetical protein